MEEVVTSERGVIGCSVACLFQSYKTSGLVKYRESMTLEITKATVNIDLCTLRHVGQRLIKKFVKVVCEVYGLARKVGEIQEVRVRE